LPVEVEFSAPAAGLEVSPLLFTRRRFRDFERASGKFKKPNIRIATSEQQGAQPAYLEKQGVGKQAGQPQRYPCARARLSVQVPLKPLFKRPDMITAVNPRAQTARPALATAANACTESQRFASIPSRVMLAAANAVFLKPRVQLVGYSATHFADGGVRALSHGLCSLLRFF
jgi:hypothetical protein